MSSIKQRTKNKPVKIKCPLEQVGEMQSAGRFTYTYRVLTGRFQGEDFSVLANLHCYWSKPKHV